MSLSWCGGHRQCQMGPGEPTVDFVCFILVWPNRRGIWGQGVKMGVAYAVRARYGPVLTFSEVSGVVVMVLSPSAVPNGFWRANCGLCVFCLGLDSPTGQ